MRALPPLRPGNTYQPFFGGSARNGVFDDPVHDVFGFRDLAFQSLYHFTVGGPVDDSRLTTLPPYGARVKGCKGAMDLP